MVSIALCESVGGGSNPLGHPLKIRIWCNGSTFALGAFSLGSSPSIPTKFNLKYMARKAKLGSGKRFASLTKELAKKGAKTPEALAAFIGRKKYGSKKFAQLSRKGR